MQHRSKLSKSRFSVPPNQNGTRADQNINNDNISKRVSTSAPIMHRKSGIFSLFSSSKSTAISTPPSSPSFVNLSRKSPSPSPVPSHSPVPSSIPPNLAIRNLSPDQLNDPAFSSRPLPLFVRNPDSPLGQAFAPSSKPLSLPDSHADLGMTDPLAQNSHFYRTGKRPTSFSLPSELRSNVNSSPSRTYSELSSHSTNTSTSSLSTEKNLIMLEPPRMLSPPPAYDELSHRPLATRHTSVPALPSTQSDSIEVPPRPATTANDSAAVDLRQQNTRNRGLDPIDELDETNPLGLSLHHGGPYEVIQREITHQMNSGRQAARSKSVNEQPSFTNTIHAMHMVPFGASINLKPGQVLPRHFQPYTQHLPQPSQQQNSNQSNIHRQRSNQDHPMQHELYTNSTSRSPPRNQPNPHWQKNQPQSVADLSHSPTHAAMHVPHLQPPIANVPERDVRAELQTRMNASIDSLSASLPHRDEVPQRNADATVTASPHLMASPAPFLGVSGQEVELTSPASIYGDESDAYGGIEEEHEPTETVDPEFLHQPSPHSTVDSLTQQPNNSNAADDPIARALYAVEQARTQIAISANRTKAAAPASGFSAFSDSPAAPARYIPGLGDRPILSSASSSGPPLPLGAKPPPGQSREQAGYAPMSGQYYQPAPPAAQQYAPQPLANQYDPWHRRTTSHATPSDTGRPLLRRPTDSQASHHMTPNPQDSYHLNEHHTSGPGVPRDHSQRQYSSGVSFDLHGHERQQNLPAPSIQQSVSSMTSSRNGPVPRHAPSKLTMPQPLYNPNVPPENNLVSSPEQQQSRFRPPQHGPGGNTAMPRSMTTGGLNYPVRSSPAPPPRVQAQTIPIATDSRKVLRKRSSVQVSGSGNDLGNATGVAVPDMPNWHAPSASQTPFRSKSEIRPPTDSAHRMQLPSAMSKQKDKKAPKRLLSKKRAEF
ncbi:hypothetical protein BDP27DRAFT_881342 [Rhodocollybia butyracea]|uniref:Uncharacterized protein n=1 Tax=Rhodocollybia butyracea TaxID=206335 RepID=A0A9P5Q9A2_9AGAR|nr:hypothetical protein BDP27DRAFT_881342 [Rhodocollybia butyracea]